jgi:hypothetical protein
VIEPLRAEGVDYTFGIGGLVITDSVANALVLQSDGKLVAAGEAGDDFRLARYLSPPLLNDFVTFAPLSSTFHFTPDATGCPEGFVGTFSFEARLANISALALSDLVVAVTALTDGNLLQNADGGPAAVGA